MISSSDELLWNVPWFCLTGFSLSLLFCCFSPSGWRFEIFVCSEKIFYICCVERLFELILSFSHVKPVSSFSDARFELQQVSVTSTQLLPCDWLFVGTTKWTGVPNKVGRGCILFNIALVVVCWQFVCDKLMEVYGIECCVKNVLNLDSSTEEKFSRHLIFMLPNAAFKDNIHVGMLNLMWKP